MLDMKLILSLCLFVPVMLICRQSREVRSITLMPGVSSQTDWADVDDEALGNRDEEEKLELRNAGVRLVHLTCYWTVVVGFSQLR